MNKNVNTDEGLSELLWRRKDNSLNDEMIVTKPLID